MSKSAFVLAPLVAALLLAPSAEAQVTVTFSLPTVRFEAPPPLVVVSPGIQVVEDYDEEVYYVNNYYWVRRDDHWFRTRDYRGNWVVVNRGVPTRLVRVEPGRYRHYKQVKAVKYEKVERRERAHEGNNGGGNGGGHGGGKHHGKH